MALSTFASRSVASATPLRSAALIWGIIAPVMTTTVAPAVIFVAVETKRCDVSATCVISDDPVHCSHCPGFFLRQHSGVRSRGPPSPTTSTESSSDKHPAWWTARSTRPDRSLLFARGSMEPMVA